MTMIARTGLLAALLALAACGQTGPLYFDEDPPADQLPPSRKASAVSVLPAQAPATTEPAAPAPAAGQEKE